MKRSAYAMALLLALNMLTALPFVTEQASASSSMGYDLSISDQSYSAIDLGTISNGKEMTIDYSAEEDIDVLLLNLNQYTAWQSGATDHIRSGSDYSDSGDNYVYTFDQTGHYYLLFDNSNQNPEGADGTGPSVEVTASITLVDGDPESIKTRAWAPSGSYAMVGTPTISEGEILSIEVTCDISLTSGDDLDFLVMDTAQSRALQGSTWSWNPHASLEDTCSYDWEYETGKTTRWNLIVDNSDQARTDALDNGVMVDIELSTRSLIPMVEITDTTRLIESGDYHRVDVGLQPQNGVIDIDFSFWSHGLTAIALDDLDILVMESYEADRYEQGSRDIDILGHASHLDATGQSWSYQFPNLGSYSIIFDNTDEPSGGAGDGSDIQAEIGVTSLTIPSLFGNIWTGWHQSRHYADEGDIMVLDLGGLDSGEDVYYYIDGNNEGGSIWGAREYDILFMTEDNYNLYVNDSTFSVISEGTNYEQGEILPSVENITVPYTSDYMIVLDAADGPNSNSADENGDWIWEFIVLSEGGPISNLQAQDNHYEETFTIGTMNPPDTDGDGVRNGLDECRNTQGGLSVNHAGCSETELDDDGDGVMNDEDLCPATPDGDLVDDDGCTLDPDTDGDGVSDGEDLCAETPVTESADSNGCSASQKDTDGDGISDAADLCEGHDDSADADGDGVPDGCDTTQEPETVAILRVNEVADKGTSDTCDGKDWIELHNAGTGTADLSGMVLVDDKGFGDEDRYTFANGSSLSGGEYLVLCRSADFAFGIGGDDAVTLFAADGTEVSTSGTMGDLGASDNTWAYFAEGYAYTEAPTPGAVNTADALDHGCTYWPASNYDPDADIDDDSCIYDRPGENLIFCLADEDMTCSSESNYLEATIAPGEKLTFVFVLENKGDSDIVFTQSGHMKISSSNGSRQFGFASLVEGWGGEDDEGEVPGKWESDLGVQYYMDQDSEICDGCILQAGDSTAYFEKSLTPGSEAPPGTYKWFVTLVRVDHTYRIGDGESGYDEDWDWEYGNATIIIHVEAETILVEEGDDGLPGFGASIAMMALLGAMINRTKPRENRYDQIKS